jgi:hypothetical protein
MVLSSKNMWVHHPNTVVLRWFLGLVSLCCFCSTALAEDSVNMSGSKWLCRVTLPGTVSSIDRLPMHFEWSIELKINHTASVTYWSQGRPYTWESRWTLYDHWVAVDPSPNDPEGIPRGNLLRGDSAVTSGSMALWDGSVSAPDAIRTVGSSDLIPCSLLSQGTAGPKQPTVATPSSLVDPFSKGKTHQQTELKNGTAASGGGQARVADDSPLVDPFSKSSSRTSVQTAKKDGAGSNDEAVAENSLPDPFKKKRIPDTGKTQPAPARYWNSCAIVRVEKGSPFGNSEGSKVFGGNLCAMALDLRYCVERAIGPDRNKYGRWSCFGASKVTLSQPRVNADYVLVGGPLSGVTKAWAREPGSVEGWPDP